MKISPTIFVYTVLAIGILSIPSSLLLDTVQAQSNMTNQTSSQNQTMSKDAQALITLNVPEIKENLMNVKQSLVGGNPQDALATITDIENQLLLLKNQTSFAQDIQKIKDSIGKPDLTKAIDDLTKVQTALVKAETEMLKAEMANPQMMLSQQNMNNGQQNDNDDADNEDQDN